MIRQAEQILERLEYPDEARAGADGTMPGVTNANSTL
jgi:hypothetical protein